MKRFLVLITVLAVVALASVAFAGGEYGQCTASAQECLNHMATELTTTGWSGLEGNYDKESGSYAVTAIVADSPAEAAGIKVDDVLFGINGMKFADMNEESWQEMKSVRVPGATITYLLKRDGYKKKIDVTLAKMPESVLAAKIGAHMLEHVEVASVQ